MIGFRAALFVTLTVFVLSGGALKAMRYADRHGVNPQNVDQNAIAVFAGAGWRRLEVPEDERQAPYPRIVLEKSDCPTLISVSFLSANAELAELIELHHHGDVVYVQHGSLTDQPRPQWRFIDTLQTRLADHAAGPVSNPLPLMAISPGSVVKDPACALPFPSRP